MNRIDSKLIPTEKVMRHNRVESRDPKSAAKQLTFKTTSIPSYTPQDTAICVPFLLCKISNFILEAKD
jgi:hypothetical protein